MSRGASHNATFGTSEAQYLLKKKVWISLAPSAVTQGDGYGLGATTSCLPPASLGPARSPECGGRSHFIERPRRPAWEPLSRGGVGWRRYWGGSLGFRRGPCRWNGDVPAVVSEPRALSAATAVGDGAGGHE